VPILRSASRTRCASTRSTMLAMRGARSTQCSKAWCDRMRNVEGSSVVTEARARLLVDHRHFAEEMAGAEDLQDDLAPFLVADEHLHAPRLDHVERIPDLALREDDRVLRVALLDGDRPDHVQFHVVHLREERDGLQRSVRSPMAGFGDGEVMWKEYSQKALPVNC